MSKKAASRTRRHTAASNASKSPAKAKTKASQKSFLFREVELGIMGLVAVILVVLFIGVTGTMALSMASL